MSFLKPLSPPSNKNTSKNKKIRFDLADKVQKVGYKSVIDLGREEKVPFPHNIGDYPHKNFTTSNR